MSSTFEITEAYQSRSGFTEWANNTPYPGGSIVISNSDNQYYKSTIPGTSNGDDSDLAGGSDIGVTWFFYADGPRINDLNVKA